MKREEFIKRSKDKHGIETYDYSLLTKENYTSKEPIPLICHKLDEMGKEHGVFYVYISNHLNSKKIHKCPKCSKNYRLKQEDVIKLCTWKHSDKYDYTKLVYKRNYIPFTIICHETDENGIEHGEFQMDFKRHYTRGYGCPKCAKRYNYTTDEWVKMAKSYIKEEYLDFSQVNYVNNKTPIKLICHKVDNNNHEHGEFFMRPDALLWQHYRCPKCNTHFLEEELRLFLEERKIEFVQQFHADWLGKLSLDFFLPQYNVAIECQGLQHFKPINFWGGSNTFKAQIERDSRKRKLCEDKKISLLYYSNLHIKYPYNVYEDKNRLLNEILNKHDTARS